MANSSSNSPWRWLLIGVPLAIAGCGLLIPQPPVVLRPGCEIRVFDSQTGMPLPQVRVTVLTLFQSRDTIGHWTFLTDDAGTVVFSSLYFSRDIRPRPGSYDYVVVLEYEGYAVYSQRLTNPMHRIALSRRHPIADTSGPAGWV